MQQTIILFWNSYVSLFLLDDSLICIKLFGKKTTHSQNSYQLHHCVIHMAHQQYLFGKNIEINQIIQIVTILSMEFQRSYCIIIYFVVLVHWKISRYSEFSCVLLLSVKFSKSRWNSTTHKLRYWLSVSEMWI